MAQIAGAVKTMFLSRTDKNARHAVFEKIQQRQVQVTEGKANPLIIFPEGCSTNGEYLITFKKGAFASLMPVKPLLNVPKSLRGDSTMGYCINMWHWGFIVFQCVWMHFEHTELPVFAPNEYFWKHHWDGKDPEERWKVYANAVREVMAEVGGFKLSDATMEDKLAYKNLVWGYDVSKKEE